MWNLINAPETEIFGIAIALMVYYHGERFNAYSHLAGFLLAVAALVLMLVKAQRFF